MKLAPGKKLTELDGNDINRFKEWLATRAKMTQKGYATALRRLLEWLGDQGREPYTDAMEGLLTLKRKKFRPRKTAGARLPAYLNNEELVKRTSSSCTCCAGSTSTTTWKDRC